MAALATESGMRMSPATYAPCCIYGHANLLGEHFSNELGRVGIHIGTNDSAFTRGEGRISFAEWCKRLNVVRGES